MSSSILYPKQLARQQRRPLYKLFCLVTLALVILSIFLGNPTSILGAAGALLITFFALLPSYLWVSGRILGLPIFPLFALTYLWTHALQLLNHHPNVSEYSPIQQFWASFTVALYLCVGTGVWFWQASKIGLPLKFYRGFQASKSKGYFIFILFLGVLFSIGSTGGWFYRFGLQAGSFALIRGLLLGLTSLSVFALSLFLSYRQLSSQETFIFIFLLVSYLISNTASLLIVGSLSITGIYILATIVGTNKIPWKIIIIAFLFFSTLHIGKGEMRQVYWFNSSSGQSFVQPWQYPEYYSQWIEYSIKNIGLNANQANSSQQSISERSGLMHILLMTQSRAPNEVSYLYGKTYQIIPELLIPRLLNPNKIRSHEGTYILNIHYGRQRREDTFTTTIGWGMLAEAYANFGLLGCIFLGSILGYFYGFMTRLSVHVPPYSFRYLLSVLVLSFSFQTEFSAGVYVAALYQGVVALTIIAFVFMKKVPQSHLAPYG